MLLISGELDEWRVSSKTTGHGPGLRVPAGRPAAARMAQGYSDSMRSVWLMVLAAAYLIADSGAGVQWTQPKNWQAQAQRPMRLATYVVPDGGECGVYYFGPGQGGGVQANVERWVGQFPEPE